MLPNSQVCQCFPSATSHLIFASSIEFFPIHTFCGTFNVNGKKTNDVDEWLFDDGPLADVYAIGLQELVDLNVTNIVVDDPQNDVRVFLYFLAMFNAYFSNERVPGATQYWVR